jgi:hypothetical protein
MNAQVTCLRLTRGLVAQRVGGAKTLPTSTPPPPATAQQDCAQQTCCSA